MSSIRSMTASLAVSSRPDYFRQHSSAIRPDTRHLTGGTRDLEHRNQTAGQ
jgi:hypothetical protein